jgi:hypothetical protein
VRRRNANPLRSAQQKFSSLPHKTQIKGLVSQELAAANFQCVLRAFHTSSHGQFRAHSTVMKG